jgi:hypothetical protein
MSLINDALKRANQTPKRNPAPAPPLTPLQPVEAARGGGGGGSSYLIPVLLALVLGLAGVFLWMWAKSSQRVSTLSAGKSVPERSVPPAPVASLPIAAPVPVAKAPATSVAPASGGLVPAKYGIKISTNLVVRTNAAKPVETAATAPETGASSGENPAAVTTTAPVATVVTATPSGEVVSVAPAAPPVPKPEFPTLKLQGIFFRQSNPSVLINGKTLRTGERIEGVRIIKIERDNVTLEWSGQTRVVMMDQ